MTTGKIIDSVGFSKPAGIIRKLNVRDRLQQVVNLGQPKVIHQHYDKIRTNVVIEDINLN